MSPDSPRRLVHHGAFGNDRFGVLAERFARFFGTPRFIIGQTVLVVLWIAVNAAAVSFRWDPYPFMNTQLTEEIARLTTELHAAICPTPKTSAC